ncbi:MAG: type I glyceraldehyde-3-phosphate dehydrogenase, partial [Gammaproteobacteria bacterium]|nr:type I glyceraldehyde-3-phosphate dehydrogenase [Gammaproteobacteria bacterium]
LKGRLHGMATRVPVLNGSVVDLFAELESEVAAEEVNAAIKIASDRDGLRGIIEYSQTPIVSSDIIGNLHSSIFDSLFTQTRGKYIKILSWYDNEWGYSNRICDALKLISLLD